MNTREIVQKLHAYHQGKPLPRGETLRVHVAADRDILVVAFVRTGGESRPWGIAFGHPGSEPAVLTVPEGRNRDLVAAMAHEFAPVLLGHIRTPGFVPVSPSDRDDLGPLRQIWVPNPSHLEMLHQLSFAYTYTRWGGDMQPTLNAFGRCCGWLFRESQRPGQQHLMVATDALRSVYTFPTEDVRQGHLGFLLSWLGAGSRDERMAAAMAAERQSIATNLDPAIERDRLERPLERWAEARKNDDLAAMTAADEQIAPVLGAELAHRHRLTAQAIGTLRTDSRRQNRGVQELVTASLQEQWSQHTEIEKGFNGEPEGRMVFLPLETDRNPAAAAARYHAHEASAERAESALIHDDRELLAELLAVGEAFRGTITAVRDDGEGKSTRPIWTVHQPFASQMRLRPGSRICVLGHAKREAVIRDLRDAPSGGYEFDVEITNRKKAVAGGTGMDAIPPANPRWIGHDIVFIKKSAADISVKKSYLVWKKGVPGGWLTHAKPGGVLSQATPEEARNAEAAA
jgi:hypothetical protein